LLPSRLIEVFAVLGFLILVAVNKLSADTPAIDLLTIGVFMAASYKIIPGIIKILNCSGQIKTYQFTLTDLSLPANPQTTVTEDKPAGHLKSLKFDKVYFKYHDQTVLNNVSFQMEAGDFTGISA